MFSTFNHMSFNGDKRGAFGTNFIGIVVFEQAMNLKLDNS